MKKSILSAVFICGFMLSATFPQVTDADLIRGWIPGCSVTPLQITLCHWGRAQLFDSSANCLAAFGAVTLCQKSAILSCAPVNVLQKNFFLQKAAFLNLGRKNYFLSVAPVNFIYENFALQAGLFNVAFNAAGIQTGAANFGGMMQIGLLNISSKIQIGLLNKEGCIQIGLLNHNPNALIQWMPFFNIGFPEPEENGK